MKTSIQTDYHASFNVNSSAREAAEAIGNVSAWWTENCQGSARKLNDIFTVSFGETFVRFKINEMIPEKRIVWRVMDCYLHWLNDKTEWKNTSILWEISTVNDSTQVEMTHLGLKPGIECFDDCVKGWDQYVKDSLFRLLAEGKGAPEKAKK
jgi:hypothetical protein